MLEHLSPQRAACLVDEHRPGSQTALATLFRALEALGIPKEMQAAITDAIRREGWEVQSCRDEVMFVR